MVSPSLSIRGDFWDWTTASSSLILAISLLRRRLRAKESTRKRDARSRIEYCRTEDALPEFWRCARLEDHRRSKRSIERVRIPTKKSKNEPRDRNIDFLGGT